MTDLLDLDVDGPNPWKTRSSRVVFDNGRMRLRQDDVIQPDGAPGSYAYLEVPWPVVAIVPVDDAGYVYLVRQWRYPWRRNSWEIPAGGGEAGETSDEAAARELAEEVGLQATQWHSLGEGFSSAAFDARYHLYLAQGLSPAEPAHRREGAEDDLIVRRFPLKAAIEAAAEGRIEHSISVIGLLRTGRRLRL